jgi:hypothetical protein
MKLLFSTLLLLLPGAVGDGPGECPAGTTCTPFEVAGVHLGACL